MSETYLKTKVMKALKRKFGRDIFFFKVHGSEYMMNGLPDIICCYLGAFVGLELKDGTKKPTPVQILRKNQITRAGGISVIIYSVEEAIAAVESSQPRYPTC